MRLTGHGTITDLVIVLAIIIGVAIVITLIIRSLVYGATAIDMIAPAKQLIRSDPLLVS
jgi:hypothetical protein